MKIIKFSRKETGKILFGIVLPSIIYDLYTVSVSEEAFERVLRQHLNIDPKRLIKLSEAVQSNGEEILILVIFDKIVKGTAFIKEKSEAEVKDFNFNIYKYNFNEKIDIELQLQFENGRQ